MNPLEAKEDDLSKVKAVLLDLDDVLRATHESVIPLYFNFAQLNGLRIPTEDEVKKHWGKPLEKILTGLYPDKMGKKEWLVSQFKASVPSNHRVLLFPGVIKTLDKLKKQFQLGVISSTATESVQNSGLDRRRFFHFQVGEDCLYHKPQKEVFDAAMLKLRKKRISESQVLYVGDHVTDLQAAINREILFVAVLTGFTTRDEFEKERALPSCFILNHINDLPARLGL